MKIKVLFLILIAQFTFAQQRTCGVQQVQERIMSNPELRQNYLNLQEKFEEELQKQLYNRSSNVQRPNVTIRIPVAVHYPSVATSASSSLKTCLRTLAQNQINILNADYNATNADISNWASASSFYPGTNIGNMDVQFILATQNHPAGTGLVNGDVAVTFGTDFLSNADTDATWAGYCNLVVRNISGGILGYSPLGGSPSGGMTVVIDNNAFGSGSGCTGYVPGAPYNLGRTLTHELGHFFNLYHTFQACDGSNCSTSGDRVCDTPPANTPYYDCVDAGSVSTSCGSIPQLTMNYMDYVSDSCMYMFTAGQATRMTAWYNTIASQLNMNTLGDETFLSNNFSIVPNPNKGTFTINFKEVMNDYSLQIFDATGRIVFENDYTNNDLLQQNISLNSTERGIYFVNIKSQGTLVTKKIIIE